MKTQKELKDIQDAIIRKGLKKKWLAQQIQVSQPTISLFLRGERTISEVKYNTLTKLLGV